jgi:hypothetical protein
MSILGARQGMWMTYLTDWDFKNVRDFKWLNNFYNENIAYLSEGDVLEQIKYLGGKLNDHIDIPIIQMSAEDSKFFKTFNFNKKRQTDNISTFKNHRYDIVMITYNERNADSNYGYLRQRFPEAKRIHGVKGIHQAHIEAAKICSSDMFWVVDGDALIDENFNFGFCLHGDGDDYVRVWRCKNPINDLIYGYGGVKLLPRLKTLNMNINSVDMTTSISDKYLPMPEISNITSFNTDPFNTWRSAFRECCKLSSNLIDRQINDETRKRLDVWCSVGSERPYGQFAISGAMLGKKYGEDNKENMEKLKKINDFDWLKELYDKSNINTNFKNC